MPEPVEAQDVSVADLLAGNATAPEPTQETPDVTVQTEGQGEGHSEVVPTLKDRVAELGFNEVSDDSEATERLIAAYSQQREREQELQQQMDMLRYQMQLAQQGAQPAQQVQGAQQAQAQQAWFNAPKTNEQIRQQFVAGRGEDGSVQWKPNTPPQVVAEYEAEQAYYTDWANRLVHDPVNALAGFKAEILAESQRQAQEFYAQQAQRQQADTYVEQQIRENEDAFYQKDPVSKQIRRDFQDRPMLTEAGIRFESILGELERSGVADETVRWKYALQSYKAQYGDLKQQASEKIAQARAGHAAKTQAAQHIAPRNGQESVKRQQDITLGGRVFGIPELSGLSF